MVLVEAEADLEVHTVLRVELEEPVVEAEAEEPVVAVLYYVLQ